MIKQIGKKIGCLSLLLGLSIFVTWNGSFNNQPEDENDMTNSIRKLLYPPSSLPYNLKNTLFQKYSTYSHSLSWNSIYNFTRILFENQTSGFFIEAGALDGEHLSNTLWLEKINSWDGLLVEPHPTSFREILKKNRKCWKLNSCFSTVAYPRKFAFRMPSPETDLVKGYDWLLRGHASIVDTDKVEDSLELFKSDFTPTDFISVYCYPLDKILKAMGRFSVDFLSIDIEKGELQVLKTIPWDIFNIKSLVVESKSNKNEVINFLVSKKYLFIGKNRYKDYFFVKNNIIDNHMISQLRYYIN